MNEELSKKDPHGDWPCKTIVMTEPWTLSVVSNHEGFEEHESFMAFVRHKAIRKEDFNESSLPSDLRDFVKKYKDDEYYPNIVEAITSGDSLEEAIEDMRKKLRLLDYGYILMDDYFYRNNILDRNNGGWMIDDDEDDDEDDGF